MLKANAERVKRLSPVEIWLFVIARVLIGFGFGILAIQYFPHFARDLGVPAIGTGALLFAIASIGFFRDKRDAPTV